MSSQPQTDVVIWRRELHGYLGPQLSESKLQGWVSKGMLPKPDVKLTQKTTGWRLSRLRAAGFVPGITELPPPSPVTYQIQPQAFNVYRHFDAQGVLLYVGMSLSAVTRLGSHRQSPWIWSVTRVDIERFATRDEAAAAEKAAIQSERPLFNVVHRRRVGDDGHE